MSVISEVFAPAEVSPESTFDDLGASSLHLLRLVSSFNRRFDVALDVVDMFSVDNVGDLIRLVEERMARSGLAPT
jgi:acyl carrier protein